VIDLEELKKTIVRGDSDAAFRLTATALKDNIPAFEILDRALIPGLKQVGDLFESGEYFLPELIVSGDAVSKALELIEPILGKEHAAFKVKYAIGTVKGDIHDLGKNIVIMMLRGNGWEVTDLGVDVSAEEFCSAVRTGEYRILGLSSLLTMTMPNVAKTIEALKEAGLRDKVKVMVGGAPTSAEWAQKIGADAHAKDAPSAARVAAALIGK